MSIFRRRKPRPNNGCGFILFQGIVICLLLVINSLFVKTFWLVDKNWGEEIRISQALQFILPILLILAQLWLFDLLTARFTRHPS